MLSAVSVTDPFNEVRFVGLDLFLHIPDLVPDTLPLVHDLSYIGSFTVHCLLLLLQVHLQLSLLHINVAFLDLSHTLTMLKDLNFLNLKLTLSLLTSGPSILYLLDS